MKWAIVDVQETLQGPRQCGSAPDRGQKRTAGAPRWQGVTTADLEILSLFPGETDAA